MAQIEVLASNTRRATWFEKPPTREDDVKLHARQLDGHGRLQAIAFLFVGGLSNIVGYTFAGLLGMYTFLMNGEKGESLGPSIFEDPIQHGVNFMGDRYPSGLNFQPATVGEMVHDPRSDNGKVYFAFTIIGAVCLLMSSYPWYIRGAYTSKTIPLPVSGHVSLNVLRQFVPPVGQILVCCITLPMNQTWKFTWQVAAFIHWGGGVAMVGVYFLIECYTIGCCGFKPNPHFEKFSNTRERRARRAWMWACAVFCAGFLISTAIASAPWVGALKCGPECSCTADAPWTRQCTDQWVVPTRENMMETHKKNRFKSYQHIARAISENSPLLFNTARGWVVTLKQFAYMCEVGVAVAIFASHLSIWRFSTERKIGLDEELPQLRL